MRFCIKFFSVVILATFLGVLCANSAFCQAELSPWGNLQGIRLGGQLMSFESSLVIRSKGGLTTRATGREKQRKPVFRRIGNTVQEVYTNIDSIYFHETVSDEGPGLARVVIELISKADTSLDGAFFRLESPDQAINVRAGDQNKLHPVPLSSSGVQDTLKISVRHLLLSSADRQIELLFTEPQEMLVRGSQLWIPLHKGSFQKGLQINKSFLIKVSGTIDLKPVNISLTGSAPGRVFDGLGGNFRIQNLQHDPQVIDYNLSHMRLRWGRVEMPWRLWQPAENIDGALQTRDSLHPAVKRAMEMAQRLSKLGIPVILTAWFPPQWAVLGEIHRDPHFNGIWGNALNKAKLNAVYSSIGSYIHYLKSNYGVDVKYFSFNESDLGINVRMTGEEHLEFIKGMGAWFAAHKMTTKLLLGDNSDATTWKFIEPALNDTSSYKYIGAVSFHSWRGWNHETLQHWADASSKIHLPLLVGEGSIDAAAYNYPSVFLEQTYALEEINLYVRLLSICQPASILQWQMTSDYSLLAGGGMFGDNSALHPTQRFWNLKQLSLTPPGLRALKIDCDGHSFTASALGDILKGVYVFHLVNEGAGRKVVFARLPLSLNSLKVYQTSKDSFMKGSTVKVVHGKAQFMVPSQTYETLVSE